MTLAVATVVTSAETEAAIDAVSKLKVLVALATAVTGGPVTDGEGASSTAAKSNICGAGAGAPAARWAIAAAMRMLDLILTSGSS